MSLYHTSSENIRFLVLSRRFRELNTLDTYAGVSVQPAKVYDIQDTTVFDADNALTKIRQLPPGNRPQSNPYREYRIVRKMLREAGLPDRFNRRDAQHALKVLGSRYPEGPDETTPQPPSAPRPPSAPQVHPEQSTNARGPDMTKSSYYDTSSGTRRILARMAGMFGRPIRQPAEPVIEYRTPVTRPLWDSHGKRRCYSVNFDDQPSALKLLVNRSNRPLSCDAGPRNIEDVLPNRNA